MSAEILQPQKIAIKTRIDTTISKGRRELMRRMQENILTETPRHHHREYIQSLENFFALPDGELYFPAVFGTHKAHNGAFPMMEEAEDIRQIANKSLPPDKQIRGSALLVASNIGTTQTEEIVAFWQIVQPTLEKLNVKQVIPVLRQKDMEGLAPEAREKYMKKQNRELTQALRDRLIPLVLPEASVESGRQKKGGKPGEINGMIRLEPSSTMYLIRLMERQKTKPLIIPMGNTGENRIYDPITEKVTKESMVKAAARSLPGGTIFVRPIMSSHVGLPLSSQAIERRLKDEGLYSRENFDQYIGELLGNLLPPDERGFYAEPQLLHRIGLPYTTYRK